MSKFLKRNLIALVLMFSIMLVTSKSIVYASENKSMVGNPYKGDRIVFERVDSYEHTTGSLWWKKTYDITVYEDKSGICLWAFWGEESLSTGFDWKGYYQFLDITQSRTLSIGAQDMTSLNPGVSADVLGVIKGGVSGTVSKTRSRTWGANNMLHRRVEVGDPAGYYSYNVMIATKRLKYTGTPRGTVIIHAPYGDEPFRGIIFNPSTSSCSGASRFDG